MSYKQGEAHGFGSNVTYNNRGHATHDPHIEDDKICWYCSFRTHKRVDKNGIIYCMRCGAAQNSKILEGQLILKDCDSRNTGGK